MAGQAPGGRPGGKEHLPPKQGVTSAVNDVSRELGGALGIAAIGSAFNGPYRASIAASDAIPTPLIGLAQGLRRRRPPRRHRSCGPAGGPVADAVREAFMHGWGTAMTVATAALTARAVIVAVRTPDLPTATFSTRPLEGLCRRSRLD